MIIRSSSSAKLDAQSRCSNFELVSDEISSKQVNDRFLCGDPHGAVRKQNSFLSMLFREQVSV